MSTRCSSSDLSSRISGIVSQVKQYKSILAATEKAATERKLFPPRIYDEDKVILQAMIAKKLLAMEDIMRQCSHHSHHSHHSDHSHH